MACNKNRVKILANPKPLMIGIIEVIRPLVNDSEYAEISKAIKSYTQRLKYFSCLSHGGKRYHLDGQASGDVTKKQMLVAENKISAFMRKKENKLKQKKEMKKAVKTEIPHP